MNKIKKIIKSIFERLGFDIQRSSSRTIPMISRWMNRLIYLSKRYGEISSVEGDIVECGVGRGRTFVMLAHLISEDKNKNRYLWGFDSFEGFPEPTREDDSFRRPKKGEWGDTSIQKIIWLLMASGIKNKFIKEKIKLVPGFFDKSLKDFPNKKIALLHIDVDLYDSYKDALRILFPKVSKGGIVLFDEYNESKWPGATKAIDEYFKDYHYQLKRDESVNKYYLIK